MHIPFINNWKISNVLAKQKKKRGYLNETTSLKNKTKTNSQNLKKLHCN